MLHLSRNFLGEDDGSACVIREHFEHDGKPTRASTVPHPRVARLRSKHADLDA
jgi:hypothetical protein